jgi:hypothetical protein
MGISTGSAAAAGRLLATAPGLPPALRAALPATVHDRPLAAATLLTWLFTASLGAFMLSRWILHGGLRQRRAAILAARARPAGQASAAGQASMAGQASPAGQARPADRALPPWVVFAHFGAAVTGLLLWAVFVVTGWDPLAWAATGLLMPAIGLGICTVTLWTPYPTYPAPSARAEGTAGGAAAVAGARHTVTGPAGGMLAAPAENALAARLTDEDMARALTDDALARRLTEEVLASIPPGLPRRGQRKPTGHLAPLIPAAHGMGAIATFLLAVLAAIGPH